MTRSCQLGSLVLVGLLLLTGCRTYGNEGYESQRKTYAAIQETMQQLDQDLGRAQSDLRQLESAADSLDTLKPLADRYHALVSSHEATLALHRGEADELSEGSSYRSLHQAYGALITDRRLLQRQYERTIRAVWATVRDTIPPLAPARRRSTYMTTPIGFTDAEAVPAITMARALQGAEGSPGRQQQEAQPEE